MNVKNLGIVDLKRKRFVHKMTIVLQGKEIAMCVIQMTRKDAAEKEVRPPAQ